MPLSAHVRRLPELSNVADAVLDHGEPFETDAERVASEMGRIVTCFVEYIALEETAAGE